MVTSKNTATIDHEAILCNANGFTAFSYGGHHICVKAPYSLERYVDGIDDIKI